MRFPQPARQAQPFLDERQRGVLPPPAQQNVGAHIQEVGCQEAVVGGAGNGQRFLAVLLGECVAAGLIEEVGRCGQGPRAEERRPRGSWCGKERPEGVDSLRGVPPCLPEHPQGGDQLETGCGVGLSQAEGDRGTEIVEFEIEKIQPLGLIVRDELRSRRLRESQVVVAMGSPRVVCRRWALAFELPGRVLPDRFQQPVPGWSGAAVVELHEVLVDQGPQVRDSLVRKDRAASGDRLGRGQVEPAGEHRKPGEHLALGGVQQLPRPVDHGQQRLLARQRRARAASQQGETLVEPGVQLGHRHDSQAGSGQLDGQRNAVEPSADPAGNRSGSLIPGERHPVLRGAVSEQPHGLGVADRLRSVVLGWCIEGRNPVDVLTGDAQRFTAGGEQHDVRAAPEQSVRQLGARIDDVLAVIQQHKEAVPPDGVDEGVGRWPASSTGMPSTLATVTATSSGSCSGARSTNHTPSPEPSKSPAASWSASRVLPAPPEPVRVTRREAAINRPTSLSSASRPMKLDTWTGRLFRSFGLSSDRSGGNAVARPSASSWKICPGRPRSFNRCSPRSFSDAPTGIESPSRAAVAAETRVCPPWPTAATRAAR